MQLTLAYPGDGVSGTRMVVLACDPAGGTHPEAGPACADLAGHNGAFDHDPAEGICAMIYRPVVARASGSWRGKAVAFSKEYGNECLMHARTGKVFAF
ncbi:SSI family serine proteinase inhibitor [Actinomadura rupiterrae]|uniref:SSI family serine proteinase inhibitor n=1 Tax=Actinomadura rupiterrae TaxID=559627 RepID=UPI0020A55A8B|nr:SSI family serine proteinase inhibitor [Actinomadura rupiterrae]MCP2337031.1 hypothetical protein [Actinomadura rupiterrae]